MTAEWFSDEGRIVETAWGRFQDVPIFRALSREHNRAATGGYVTSARPVATEQLHEGEWVWTKP